MTQVGDHAGRARRPPTAAEGDRDGQPRAGEQPRRRGTQRDQDSGRGGKGIGGGDQLGQHAPGQEGQRRAHHDTAQPAGPRIAGDQAAGHHEYRVGEQVPAGPGRDQQAEEAGGEQRQYRAAAGQRDGSRTGATWRPLYPRLAPRGPGLRHRTARTRLTSAGSIRAPPSSGAVADSGAGPGTSSGADRARGVSSTTPGTVSSPSTTPSSLSLRALGSTRLSSEPTVWLYADTALASARPSRSMCPPRPEIRS